MEIIRQLKRFLITGLIVSICMWTLTGLAFAATSITPGIFTKLVGLFIQPITTSNSYTTQLQSPTLSAASSTVNAVVGNLTPGPLDIEVAAVTPSGTSSPSNEIATTSLATHSQIQLTWPPVPGATGYAVYVGTSTPGSEGSYFTATSTGGTVNTYFTLQSTSTPTYYAVPGQGAGYYAQHGSGTTTLDTTGLIRSYSNGTTTCSAALNGAIFYSSANAHLWLCTGAGPAWTLIK